MAEVTVNMHKAKTELSKLVARALAGEEIVLTRNGKPVVRLVPILQKRVPGSARGLIWVGPDFDDPLPEEILRDFEGG
ncbi:MAG: type II toxin-antitoxin system Phd/YefM family antitoxin [Chloroflexi bacterium]|nr:type II toxin-antitoxin system Phd/YefM family antitoxin [Chloroflexota bacterium]